MKKPVMNFDEFSTVKATTFYLCGSFNGLCNYGIIYEHLRLQFNLYYNCMRVVIVSDLMHADYGGSLHTKDIIFHMVQGSMYKSSL